MILIYNFNNFKDFFKMYKQLQKRFVIHILNYGF